MSIESFNYIANQFGSQVFNIVKESDQGIPPVDFNHRILPDGTFRIYDNSLAQEVERIVKI